MHELGGRSDYRLKCGIRCMPVFIMSPWCVGRVVAPVLACI